MYSEAIVTSPVALFLGAGASKPFDKKLMAEFIKHLAQRTVLGQEPLFNEIINSETGADLEHLFEELDEWSRKQNYKSTEPLTAEGRNLRFLGMASGDSSGITSGVEIANVAREASRILNELRKAVFNEYCNIEDKWREPLVRAFDPVFTVIFDHVNPTKHPVPVFTTNYDPAIETFCAEKAPDYVLRDGFVLQPNAAYVWREQAIHALDVTADPRKHIALFKLHGSTGWYEMGGNFVKSPVPLYTAGRDGIANLLIYPAKRKVALNNPYFTAYDYFQRTLEHCKLCVVIGYSFRDYDALSRLRSAAAFNASLRVLVIDPNADSLCQGLRTKGVNAEPLTAHFGKEEGAPLLPSSSKGLNNLEALKTVLTTPHLASLPAEVDYLRAIKSELAVLSSVDARKTMTETPTPPPDIPAGQSPN